MATTIRTVIMNSLRVFFFATLLAASLAVDYCRLNCSLGENSACKCSLQGQRIEDLSSVLRFRKLILERHNDFRNRIALGEGSMMTSSYTNGTQSPTSSSSTSSPTSSNSASSPTSSSSASSPTSISSSTSNTEKFKRAIRTTTQSTGYTKLTEATAVTRNYSNNNNNSNNYNNSNSNNYNYNYNYSYNYNNSYNYNYRYNYNSTQLPQASNMNALSYDVELEHVARCYARKYVFYHDQCRRTPKFNDPGQVILRFEGNQTLDSLFDALEERFDFWLHHLERGTIDNYTGYRGIDGVRIDSLTEIIWWSHTHLGCARVYNPEPILKMDTYVLICNFGGSNSSNVVGQPVYRRGPPCSQCPFKVNCNRNFVNLCGDIYLAVGNVSTLSKGDIPKMSRILFVVAIIIGLLFRN